MKDKNTELNKTMQESDLYLPLKRFLESQNYEVKGEVHDCDTLAVRGKEDPVVVELKPRRPLKFENKNANV